MRALLDRTARLKSQAEKRGIVPSDVCKAHAVQRVFAEHRSLFETLEAACVSFATNTEAEAVRFEASANPSRFPVALPVTPQVLPSASGEGYLGLVTRADLSPEVAEVLFADDAGQIVGPLAYDSRWWVYRILVAKRPELNESVYAFCEAMLLEQALGAA